MRRRHFLALFGGAMGLRPLALVAEQPSIPRIGVLMGGSPGREAAKLGVFREALKQLGYNEGQTVLIEPVYAEGRSDRLPMLAREMVAGAPAIIVCVGGQEAAALRAVTRTIPIVFMQVANPVEIGLISTLARPGGNVTGFTQMSAELDLKRLELLHEIAPKVSRAALLMNPRAPRALERAAIAQAAAKSLGIALRRLGAATPTELTAALAAIDGPSGEALLVQNDPLLTGTEASRISDFAVAHRVLTIYESKVLALHGGLASLGPNLNENYRLTAGYVDKILKGAKPADLPVQRPTTFELAINLKTAKALGLTIPQSVLARADEVIE
jgi:ABC-type uncharacterized transport system substrate-binding protein